MMKQRAATNPGALLNRNRCGRTRALLDERRNRRIENPPMRRLMLGGTNGRTRLCLYRHGR